MFQGILIIFKFLVHFYLYLFSGVGGTYESKCCGLNSLELCPNPFFPPLIRVPIKLWCSDFKETVKEILLIYSYLDSF